MFKEKMVVIVAETPRVWVVRVKAREGGSVQFIQGLCEVIYNKEYIFSLSPSFWHWSPKTLGIS